MGTGTVESSCRYSPARLFNWTTVLVPVYTHGKGIKSSMFDAVDGLSRRIEILYMRVPLKSYEAERGLCQLTVAQSVFRLTLCSYKILDFYYRSVI